MQRRDTSRFGDDPTLWFAAWVGLSAGLLSSLPGDFNGDSILDAADIELFFSQMRSPTPDPAFDLNRDNPVKKDDRDGLVKETIGLADGDANFDGRFNSEDIVALFLADQYEDDVADNSTGLPPTGSERDVRQRRLGVCAAAGPV